MLQRRKLHVIYGISNADYAFCTVVWLIAKFHRCGICQKDVLCIFFVPHILIFVSKIKPRHFLLSSVKRYVKACAVGDENDVTSKKVIAVLFDCQNWQTSWSAEELDGEQFFAFLLPKNQSGCVGCVTKFFRWHILLIFVAQTNRLKKQRIKGKRIIRATIPNRINQNSIMHPSFGKQCR